MTLPAFSIPAAVLQAASPLARVRGAEGGVELTWADGRQGRFSFLWLRDNCGCPECKHPQTLERIFDILSVPEDLEAAAEIDAEGLLALRWSHDGHLGEGHVSRYPGAWLLQHREETAEGAPEQAAGAPPPPRLWGRGLAAVPAFDYETVMGSESGLAGWLTALAETGLTVLTGAGTAAGTVARAAERVAYVRETNFGAVFDVISKPDPNSNAYTAIALKCHSDLPNWLTPPGVQFFHCLANEARGGDSIYVDGYAACETLRDEAPEAFELLSREPVTFRFRDDRDELAVRAPVVTLDAEGRPAILRFNFAIMDVAPGGLDRQKAFYAAYRKLAAIVRRPELELRLRLRPGDIAVVDNHRVLHGRDAFDPASGERRLQGCYVDREALFSRLAVLQRSAAQPATL